MPEYSHIQTYVKYDKDNLSNVISGFKNILLDIGFSQDYLDLSLDGLEWKQEDNGFVYYGCNCNPMKFSFNGIELNLRPFVMGWTPDVLPKLKESWIELCISFESEQIVADFQNRLIKDEVQEVLLKIMNMFSYKFFETGTFLTDEVMDGIPWESLMGEGDNLWAFDAAIIRVDMNDKYCPLNESFSRKQVEDKIYLFNKTTARNFYEWL